MSNQAPQNKPFSVGTFATFVTYLQINIFSIFTFILYIHMYVQCNVSTHYNNHSMQVLSPSWSQIQLQNGFTLQENTTFIEKKKN